jgi:hypothetical protein
MQLFPALLLLTLTLWACQAGPQVGDVYEHKLTRERIQIDGVGVGYELARSYREDEQQRREALTLDGAVQDFYYLSGDIVVPSYAGEDDARFDPQTMERHRPDTTAQSAAYLEQRGNYVTEQMRSDLIDRFLMEDIEYRVARILPVADLETDYTLID